MIASVLSPVPRMASQLGKAAHRPFVIRTNQHHAAVCDAAEIYLAAGCDTQQITHRLGIVTWPFAVTVVVIAPSVRSHHK